MDFSAPSQKNIIRVNYCFGMFPERNHLSNWFHNLLRCLKKNATFLIMNILKIHVFVGICFYFILSPPVVLWITIYPMGLKLTYWSWSMSNQYNCFRLNTMTLLIPKIRWVPKNVSIFLFICKSGFSHPLQWTQRDYILLTKTFSLETISLIRFSMNNQN